MRFRTLRPVLAVAMLPLLMASMCMTTPIMQMDMTVDHVALADFVVNTGGASGLAVRPSDGAVFAVNGDGLFGPLKAGDDISKMTPFGATNLASAAIFGQRPDDLALAITNKGEFWIGSACCQTIAVVPATGGNAAPFTAITNIKPDTLVIVPTGFDGTQMHPGNLLVAEEAFSRLAAVAVDVDNKVVVVSNPDATTGRNGLHMTFGPQPLLYGSRGTLDPTLFGIQTVDTTGKPTGLPGTLGTSAKSFVVLPNGDVVARGSFKLSSGSQYDGIFLYSDASQMLDTGKRLNSTEASQGDQMVRLPGGTILLSLPLANKIVTVTVTS